MNKLRIVGDVHGKGEPYLRITVKSNNEGVHTLQLGDLGFRGTYTRLLSSGLNTEMNKFFMGNHDDYNFVNQLGDFCLGDYGNVELNGVSFFFVRGAFS